MGGAGNDRLTGADGNDTAKGRAGNDYFFDGEGADTVAGGPGNDQFDQLSGGGNHFHGGPGRDLLRVQVTGDARLTDELVRTQTGRAGLRSVDRADVYLAPEYPAVTLDASGYSGNVWLRGQAGDDLLIGGSGNDEIEASSGDDLLRGGAGRDRLDGFDGRDECDGGPGRDRLVDCEVGTT